MLAVRVLRPPIPVEVITEEPRDAQFPVSSEMGRVAETPAAYTTPLTSMRIVSLASEPGATPRVQGLVRVAAGPWTLEDGWWSKQPIERDYWDVELSGGGLFRIYRDRKSGEWFADGMYD